MPAGSRDARSRGGRRRKPVGAAGTQATPSPADRPTRDADPISARTIAATPALEPTTLGLAKDQFGSQRADFIGVMGALIVRSAKDQFRAYPVDSTRLSGTLPFRRERPVPVWAILNPQATMQLEFHQLDRRWEHLRVRRPHRQRRLMASLAESGQQIPIVVVLSPDHRDRYLVIDGHKRIAALEQLGRTRWKRWSGRWRGRGSAAGPFAAFLRARNRAGARLAAGGDGAALRLWTG